MRCGNEEVPASAAGMDFPLEKGTYEFTSRFGDVGGHWESGFHTGLDFAAPIGTPVRAAKTGTVTVAKSGWGGPNLVTIDHGDGLTTLYAHMGYTHLLTGDQVVRRTDHRNGRARKATRPDRTCTSRSASRVIRWTRCCSWPAAGPGLPHGAATPTA